MYICRDIEVTNSITARLKYYCCNCKKFFCTCNSALLTLTNSADAQNLQLGISSQRNNNLKTNHKDLQEEKTAEK